MSRTIKRCVCGVMIALIICALPTAYNFAANTVNAKSVSIAPKEVTLAVGDVAQLTASVKPEKASGKLEWTSTDKKVASVSGRGLVTGRSEGTATITVRTPNKKKAKCKVTVRKYAEKSEVEELKTRIINDDTVMPRYFSLSGDLKNGDYLYDAAQANSIRSNERISFNADIASFSSLEIGFAWNSTNYKYNRFVIDDTALTVYDYNGNTSVYPHGLTVENNIQVLIESDFMRKCKVTIISNGQLFSQTGCDLNRRRVCFPYAQSAGSDLPNAELTWTCTDFDKPVWIFGDSYIASYTNKWVKYAYSYGYSDNCLWDAYSGENSEDSLSSLNNLLKIARPAIVVWCLGMNDGSDADSSTPSPAWQSGQEELRSLCESQGIELVLATIPTVPTINNEAKNKAVRESGYRYIDFAKAVGASSDGTWYSDMLSEDGIHPTDSGAKALFGRAVADLPELMISE